MRGMRAPAKFGHRRRRIARHAQKLTVAAFTFATAVRWCLAAEREEENGFPLTAAMVWRKAAELFGSSTPIGDRCWREWERIMRLPRHLAGPIGACDTIPSGPPTTADAQAPAAVALVPLAAAA